MLNREPMGMKRRVSLSSMSCWIVSVLNREPMGMKHRHVNAKRQGRGVSVLNREPMGMKQITMSDLIRRITMFQCSTASRWG